VRTDAARHAGTRDTVHAPTCDTPHAPARRLVITSTNAGGGHKATARALIEIIRRQGRPWHVEVLDIDTTIRPVDPFYQLFGTQAADCYNWMLRNDLTLAWDLVIGLTHACLGAMQPMLRRVLERKFRELQPDLVLSITPHYNRAMFASLRAAYPDVPFVTMPTDFVDYPPHSWFEPQDQHVICGFDRAAEQALDFVPDPSRISRVSGMVVNPRFFDPITEDRSAARRSLGLDPDVPTVLVFFGGSGSGRMLDIARKVAASGKRVQLVMLCGGNTKVAERLRELRTPFPMHVEGFTTDVPRFMWMSDVVIGKPGPGAISEALVMGLSIIVMNTSRTMSQERFNAEWVEQAGVGVSVREIDDIPDALTRLLDPARQEEIRERIAAVMPRAVFEVPDILERLMAPEPAAAPIGESRQADKLAAG
jgi:UDP-N-acetylglucosamine:LPS N-acetylglucosamine transferase